MTSKTILDNRWACEKCQSTTQYECLAETYLPWWELRNDWGEAVSRRIEGAEYYRCNTCHHRVWASDQVLNAIMQLQRNGTATLREGGTSMEPFLMSMEQIGLEAPVHTELAPGDVVLCRVGDKFFTHVIYRVGAKGRQFQIGNAHGKINGWTYRHNVFGHLAYPASINQNPDLMEIIDQAYKRGDR